MSDSPRREDGPLSRPGGVVVVTQFDCRTLRNVLAVWWAHRKVEPAVVAGAPGFLGVRLFIDWRARDVRSVTLWSEGRALFDMGDIDAHVRAAHEPARRGIETSCGVFGYLGDWRTVMFGAGYATTSPLVVGSAGDQESDNTPQ